MLGAEKLPRGAIGCIALLLGAALCWPINGTLAQQGFTANGPAPSDHAATGTGHEHQSGEHGDGHDAQRQQQALHEAIREKFKGFNAAVKKAWLDRLAEQRRMNAIHRGGNHHDATMPAAAATNTHAVATPGRPNLPTAVTTAQSLAAPAAPRKPTGAHPLPAVLGGAAPDDPKRGAVLNGTGLHRRL